MLKVSHSSIDGYLKCPQYYDLYKNKRVKLKTRPAFFVVGEAVHQFKQYMFEGVDFENCIKAVNDIFKKVDLSNRSQTDIEKFHVEWARTLGICEGYWNKYKQEPSIYKRIVCENKLEMELTPTVTYEGYLDMLVQDNEDNWWVHETKTASAQGINDYYFQKLRFDRQILGYMWLAANKLGTFPKGIVYDVAIKTAHRKKVKESHTQLGIRLAQLYKDDPTLLIREQIIISKQALRNWKDDTVTVANKIEADTESKIQCWPRNTGSCQVKYGTCFFMEICASGGNINEMMFDVGKKK